MYLWLKNDTESVPDKHELLSVCLIMFITRECDATA